MDKKSLERYRRLLGEKRQSLLEAFAKTKSEGLETGDENAADMADRANSAYTKEFLYSLSNTDRELLLAVEDALARTRAGDFGHCIECEEKVNKKRLDAVPWARYCVSCQEMLETGRLRP